MNEISLSADQIIYLESHAAEVEPNEACAMLLGTIQGYRVRVGCILPARNADESSTSFSISSEELLDGYKTASESRSEVVGIFHSHPHSEARPSHKDERFMRNNPVVWVIYSGVRKEFRAFVMEDKVREIRIKRE